MGEGQASSFSNASSVVPSSLGDGLISLLPENLEEEVNDLLQGGGPVEDAGDAMTDEGTVGDPAAPAQTPPTPSETVPATPNA